MNEIHPYNGCEAIPQGTQLLIIGTAPPKRFSSSLQHQTDLLPGDVNFYYGSIDNLLWRTIFPKLYPASFPAESEHSAEKWRSFLRSRRFWMHDIASEYTRQGEGARDNDLILIKAADLKKILDENATIRTLVFTGGTAETWSGKQMELQSLLAPYQFNAGGISAKAMPRKRSRSVTLPSGERKMQTFTVPSPSRNTLRSYSLEKSFELYREALDLPEAIAS